MEEAKDLSPAWGPRGGLCCLTPWEAVFSVKVVLFTLKTELPGGEWQGFVVRPGLCAGRWVVRGGGVRQTVPHGKCKWPGAEGQERRVFGKVRWPPWEAHQGGFQKKHTTDMIPST